MVTGKNTSREFLKAFALSAVLATLFFVLQAYYSEKAEGMPSSPHHLHLRIQNWNLRYDSKPNTDSIEKTVSELNSTIPFESEVDFFGDFKEAPWSKRRIGVKNDVLFNDPDFFTVNEGLYRQVLDLKVLLGMEFIGIGRDDGKTKGEFQAIFYNPHKFTLIDYDTFWISETPFVPSKYKDAGSYRSVTVGVFKHKYTATKFVLINLHLDDQSDYGRQLGAAMAKYRAAYEYETKKVPVLLVGDFNSESSGLRSGAYKIATGQKEFGIEKMNQKFVERYKNSLTNFTFSDFMEACSAENRLGNLASFTGFQETTKDYSRIDFQFGGNPNNGDSPTWEVLRFKGGDNWHDNSFYLSDHRPLITDIALDTPSTLFGRIKASLGM